MCNSNKKRNANEQKINIHKQTCSKIKIIKEVSNMNSKNKNKQNTYHKITNTKIAIKSYTKNQQTDHKITKTNHANNTQKDNRTPKQLSYIVVIISITQIFV